MNKVKPFLVFLVFSGLFFLGIYVSMENVREVKESCPGWSLRYEKEISTQTIQAAKRYSAQYNEDTGGLWPVFWGQGESKFESERREASGLSIYYDGDPALVKPAEFIFGAYPGELEENGCAVSEQLSWVLWGSTDTVGMQLRADGQELTVRGIYKSDEVSALLNRRNDNRAVWNNVEIYDPSGTVTREKIEEYAQASGLGRPDHIVDGRGISRILEIAAGLPVVGMAFAGMIALFQMQRNRTGWKRMLIVFVLLFAFAALLPWLLSMIPQWIIPSKWSDFDFWSDLYERLQTYVTDWLLLRPYEKDVTAKRAIYKQIFIFIYMIVLLPAFWRYMRSEQALHD